MKIVFLGTPDFAVLPLNAVYKKVKGDLIAVVCNKDKPVGRKQVLTAPPTKVFAEQHGIPVFQYDSIRKEGVEDLKRLAPDLMITCAFGQILSQEILDIPTFGVINIHASLLPKYRGASPIQYAILNGETETGITIMKTDIGIDTGDIILQEKIPIESKETGGELFDRLSVLGADCIKKTLDLIYGGNVVYTKQDESNATFTKMIKKEHALIDWSKNSKEIVDLIRAYNPFPVAYTFLFGQPFKIFSAEISDLKGNAGEVLSSDGGIVVGTSDGSVVLTKVCIAGGKVMPATDFLRGNKIPTGTKLG